MQVQALFLLYVGQVQASLLLCVMQAYTLILLYVVVAQSLLLYDVLMQVVFLQSRSILWLVDFQLHQFSLEIEDEQEEFPIKFCISVRERTTALQTSNSGSLRFRFSPAPSF